MSERARNALALILITGSLLVIVLAMTTGSRSEADRVESLASRLKCPVCTSESIADSPAQIARDLRDLITEQVASGWTDADVVDFFVATYGEQVLLDPAAGGTTLLLWAAPIGALALGTVVILGRRQKGRVRTLSEDERGRVAQALAERTGQS